MAATKLNLSKRQIDQYVETYRAAFKEIGESQTYIAKYLGISRASVSHYLNGNRLMSPKVAFKVGAILDINPTKLSPALARALKQEKEIAETETKRKDASKLAAKAMKELRN